MKAPTLSARRSQSPRTHRAFLFALAVASLGTVSAGRADTYTWQPTAASNTLAWNSAANWSPNTAFPNAAGDVANVTSDLVGNETINLNQAITVGTLNLGDSGTGTSNTFSIATGTGTNLLTFQAATAGAATAINISTAVGTNVANTISAGVLLGGTSPLTITANGSGVQTVNITGNINTNGNTLTLSTANTVAAGISLSNLTGSGNLIKNGVGSASFNSTAAYTGATTVNAGQLNVLNGGNLGSTSVTVNATGLLQIGNTAVANVSTINTAAAVTLNGGGLSFRGNNVASAVNTQTIDTLSAARGSSVLTILAATTNQTVLNIGTLNRTAGAVLTVQGNVLGSAAGTADSTRIFVTGTTPTLTGGGGAAGTTNISIVPWGIASTAATGANSFNTSTELLTYGANGFRALTVAAGEYVTTLPSGTTTTNNVAAVGTISLDTTFNALKVINTNGTVTISTGRTLSLTSGTVIFGVTGETIAGPGTLNFGAAEGIVSTVATNGTSQNTATISAVVAGSNGFVKGGTGLLTLTGVNTYTGTTTIAGGTLLTGATGNLGTGNTILIRGGALTLGNNTTLNDTASLILDPVSTLNLNFTGTETVGGVSLDSGTTFLTPGMTYSAADLALLDPAGSFNGTGSLTITAVPEPAEWTMIGIGGLMFVIAHRRRIFARRAA